jgi:hypothetical protein
MTDSGIYGVSSDNAGNNTWPNLNPTITYIEDLDMAIHLRYPGHILIPSF